MSSGSYRKLQYQYEVVCAQLEIRDHYIRTIIRDVYDNIGQALSLVRVRLSVDELMEGETSKSKKGSPGELVGMAIRDLRDMCQRFTPEAGIVSTEGFNRVLGQEIKNLYPAIIFTVSADNRFPGSMPSDQGMILFGILLKVFSLIKEKNEGLIVAVSLNYLKDQLIVCIDYKGKPVRLNNYRNKRMELSVFEKLQLLGGYVKRSVLDTGLRRIKIMTPIK